MAGGLHHLQPQPRQVKKRFKFDLIFYNFIFPGHTISPASTCAFRFTEDSLG